MRVFGMLLQHELGLLWRAVSVPYVLILSWVLLFLLTFFWGNFLGSNQASFDILFSYHPWVYLFLVPALSMFAWTEEIRRKTIVHFVHYPVPSVYFILAKYVAQLSVIGVFLLGTIPFFIMVNMMGNPDNIAYISGALGSFVLGSVFLAIAQLCSLLAKNKPLVAFVLAFLGGVFALYGVSFVFSSVVISNFYKEAVFGLISIPNVAFLGFVILALICLSSVLFSVRLHRESKWYFGIFMVTVAICGGSLFLPTVYVDLTESQKHTTHKETKTFLREITKPVELTLYAVQDDSILPAHFKKYVNQTTQYLENFSKNSEKINLSIKYIDLDAQIEYEAKERGAVPFTTAQGDTFIVALFVSSGEKVSMLPQLSPDRENLLEFDVVSAIQDVVQDKIPQIGIMTEMNLSLNSGSRPQFIDALLSKYGVQKISPYEPFIKEDVDLLIVFQTPTMSRESVYALDQYLVEGGKAIIFLDPFFRNAPSDDLRAADRNADDKMLDHPADILRVYGVNYDYNLIVGSNALAMPVKMNDVGLTRYPLWLNLGQEHINNDLKIARNIKNILLVESGYFSVDTSKVKAEDLKIYPLLSTDRNAQYAVREDLMTVSPQGIAEALRGDGQQYDVALYIKGKVPSLFDQLPSFVQQYYQDYAEDMNRVKYPVHEKNSDKSAEIVVFGDIDFLADEYIKPNPETGLLQNHNMILFFNVVQEMLGEGVLLPLRLRSSEIRPFTGVDQYIESEAQTLQTLEASIGEKLLRVGVKRKSIEDAIQKVGKASISQEKELEDLAIQEIELQRQMRKVQSVLPSFLYKMGWFVMAVNFIVPPLVVILVWLCYLWRRARKIKKII